MCDSGHARQVIDLCCGPRRVTSRALCCDFDGCGLAHSIRMRVRAVGPTLFHGAKPKFRPFTGDLCLSRCTERTRVTFLADNEDIFNRFVIGSGWPMVSAHLTF
jgi:hypothetical protein